MRLQTLRLASAQSPRRPLGSQPWTRRGRGISGEVAEVERSSTDDPDPAPVRVAHARKLALLESAHVTSNDDTVLKTKVLSAQ